METLISGKKIFIADMVLTVIPPNAKHVRSIELRLPYVFKRRPVIVANLYSVSHLEIPNLPEEPSEIVLEDGTTVPYVENPGLPMTVTNITYANWKTQTQITIGGNCDSAEQQVDFRYFCNYIIMGELV